MSGDERRNVYAAPAAAALQPTPAAAPAPGPRLDTLGPVAALTPQLADKEEHWALARLLTS